VSEYQYLGIWLSSMLAPERQFAYTALTPSACDDILVRELVALP
jgi:hypothetical protein